MKSYQLLFMLFVGLQLLGCQQKALYQAQVHYTVVDAQLPADPEAEAFILPYRQQLSQQIAKVLIYSADNYERPKASWQNPVGNLVADLLFEQASLKSQKPVDVSVITYGGIRTGVPAGAITVGHMFELMPFENELVILTVRGQTLLELANYMQQRRNVAFRGMQLHVRNDAIEHIFVHDQPLDTTALYRVAISDYLASGGDHMGFWQQAVDREATRFKIRDLFIEGLEALRQQTDTLHLAIDNRVLISATPLSE